MESKLHVCPKLTFQFFASFTVLKSTNKTLDKLHVTLQII